MLSLDAEDYETLGWGAESAQIETETSLFRNWQRQLGTARDNRKVDHAGRERERKKSREWYYANKTRASEYRKAYLKTESGAEARKRADEKYRKSAKGLAVAKRRASTRRYKEMNKAKQAAWRSANKELSNERSRLSNQKRRADPVRWEAEKIRKAAQNAEKRKAKNFELP